MLDHLDKHPSLSAACQSVAVRFGLGAESLRRWVRQAQVDAGTRDGRTTNELERNGKLERENRDLREANPILRDAAVLRRGTRAPTPLILAFIEEQRSLGRSKGSICMVLREQGVPRSPICPIELESRLSPVRGTVTMC